MVQASPSGDGSAPQRYAGERPAESESGKKSRSDRVAPYLPFARSSATRALTSLVTRRVGNGSASGNWIVPFAVL